MTIEERIRQALTWETEEDKLIAIIYEMGKEAATKTVCDEHNKRLIKMQAAARASRYHILCRKIIDEGGGIIYSPHYAGDITETFGDNEISLYK